MRRIRNLSAIWTLLDVCLLASGLLAVIFSVLWDHEDLVRGLAISAADCKGGLILGSMFLFSFVLSIPAFIQPIENTWLLKMLNVTLICDALGTLIVGSIPWFFSLRQRAEVGKLWQRLEGSQQSRLQEEFSCCGYWNGTSAGLLAAPTGICADAVVAANITGCVTPLTASTDYTLENTFTSIYGFMVVLGFFFLATVCVINERRLELRFRRIDAKRGGSGFV